MYNVLSPCSPISLSCNVEVKADNEPSIEVALFKEAQSKMKQKIVSTVAREQYVLGYISVLLWAACRTWGNGVRVKLKFV